MRVGDTPVIINNRGTTRILLSGSTVWVPMPRPKSDGRHTDSGSRSFAVIYVNDLARAAWESTRPADYPVGSIIVREKLAAPDAARPELLAVMVKRAHGFNKKGGDWEFLTVDGEMKQIEERQKTGSCLHCHASQRGRDYVFPPPAPKKVSGEQ